MQTDPTGISNVLALPLEVILGGAVLFFSFGAMLLGAAFLRLLSSTARANAKRDEIDQELIRVFRTTGEALQSSLSAANRAAASSEAQTQSMSGMNATMQKWVEVQRRAILPALRTIYLRVEALDKRYGKVDEIHAELRGVRTDLASAMKLVFETVKIDEKG